MEKQEQHMPLLERKEEKEKNGYCMMIYWMAYWMTYWSIAFAHAYMYASVLDKPLKDAAKDENFHLSFLLASMGSISAICWPVVDALLLFFELINLIHK